MPCITLLPTQHHSFFRKLRSLLLFTGTYFNKKVLFQIHTLINTWMDDPETSSPVRRAYCARVAAGLVHENGPALLAPVSNRTKPRGTKKWLIPSHKTSFKKQIFRGSDGDWYFTLPVVQISSFDEQMVSIINKMHL